MLRVSAAEFERDVGRYQEEALRQPVSITHDGRERLVVLSAEEYERLKRRDRRVFRTEELTGAELRAIASTEMDARHSALDDELT